MNCQLCDRDDRDDDEVFVILPVNVIGSTGPFAHYSCALDKGFVCKRHKSVHQGFYDNTHACLLCINDKVLNLAPSSKEMVKSLRDKLPDSEWEDLEDAAEIASLITRQDTIELAVLRFVVCLAERTNSTPEQVVMKILQSRSVSELLYMGIV